MTSLASPVIATEGLVAGYGRKAVLTGIDVQVHQGEIVACVGHNGAGKSTLLKVLFGCIKKWQGRITIDGRQMESARPRELLRRGVILVPQGNHVFDDLTVFENLTLRSLTAKGKLPSNTAFDRVWSIFPFLKGRTSEKAGVLSGGEKQCLALAGAFLSEPRILLLDEPSLGLAPQMAADVLERLQALNRDTGLTILVVEQRVRNVLRISNRVYVLKGGQVSHEGPAHELLENEVKLRSVFL